MLVAWGIGGHALLGYSAVGGWAYDEINEVTFAPASELALALAAIVGPSGLFVIDAFFFVAGLFTERAIHRHGWRRYASDRVVRLGLPWLVSALLIRPASLWLAALGGTRSCQEVLVVERAVLDARLSGRGCAAAEVPVRAGDRTPE